MRKLNAKIILLMLLTWMGWSGAASAANLTVNTSGNVVGAVTFPSSPTSTACTPAINTCKVYAITDPSVTLTAAPQAGSVFTGWSDAGAACGTTLTCTVTMDAAKTVTAEFKTPRITVTKTGNGFGSVTSTATTAPSGAIDCGSTCTSVFPQVSGVNATVTLSATQEAGSVFMGWSGDGASVCGTRSTCTVSANLADQVVFARFDTVGSVSNPVNFTILNEGSGSDYGRVNSSPVGITCEGAKYNNAANTDCSGAFTPGTGVTLNAAVNSDKSSFFAGWEVYFATGTSYTLQPNMCRNLELSCNVVVPFNVDDIRVKAKFNLITETSTNYVVSVTKTGTGSGKVSSTTNAATTGGIDCGGICGGIFPATTVNGDATNILLTAVADTDSVFTGWGGGASSCGTSLSCRVNTTSSITANFDTKPLVVVGDRIVSVTKTGTGAGRISATSNGGGGSFDCGLACSSIFKQTAGGKDATVTLVAVAETGSVFAGWDEPSCGLNATCLVPAALGTKNITAKFDIASSGGTASFQVDVLKEGSGTAFGTVTADTLVPINCGETCKANVSQQTKSQVKFKAISDIAGVTFSGWMVEFKRYLLDGTFVWDDYTNKVASLCVGLQPVCAVTVSSDVRIRARFDYDIKLTVVKDGSGLGSISSTSSALNECAKLGGSSNICYQTFVAGQVFELTAIPDLKSRFVKWNGCESTADGNQDGSQEVCTVTMDKAKLVTATFELIDSAKLSITKDPSSTGTGTVKSDLLGLDCGTICNRNYPFNTDVVLTATPFEGSEFVGWGGDWCSGLQLTCKVSMSQAKDVTARFDKGYKLTLNKQGAGDGSVFSAPAGINCGTACAYSFINAAVVELTAKPVNGSTFLGWGGACTGTDLKCTVSMTQTRDVTVTFSGVSLGKALDNSDLIWIARGDAPWFGQLQKDAKVKTVYVNGSAGISGLITHGQNSSVETTISGPAELSFYWKVSSEKDRDVLRFETDGIDPLKISGEVDWKQVKYSLPAGLHVLKWTYEKDADLSEGADSAWLEQVRVTLPVVGVVTVPNTLTITNNGLGSVTSSPAGISCGGVCSAEFTKNSAVMLTASPMGGSTFVGWSGACSGTALTCLVTVNGAQNVSANFNSIGDAANNAALHLGLLNDTGIDWCADKSTPYLVDKDAKCAALMATFSSQDGQVGRDASARKGKLLKIGSGDAGFDYTKICNNGQAEGGTGCPVNQRISGESASQWGCTRDNVTGLIWEIKTTTGSLRDKDKTYSWYNLNDRQNGGSKGDNCTGVECNTDAYVKAVNQQGLCGANDWRLPTRHELHSMAHQGRSNPAVDISFFPNTVASGYWTATSVAASAFNAWMVNFESGWDFWDLKSNKQRVRLVRHCDACELATAATNPVYSNALLHLPLVKVESDFYDAQLKLVSNNPMTFELSAQAKKPLVARSVSGDQVRYYLNGSLVVGNIEVGAERYNATLQLIPGSEPMRFKLLNASLVH